MDDMALLPGLPSPLQKADSMWTTLTRDRYRPSADASRSYTGRDDVIIIIIIIIIITRGFL